LSNRARAARTISWQLVALALLLGGCSRAFYRKQADREVDCLVGVKSKDPRWALRDFPVYGDERSRHFDPTNPDCPPMPLDDPASHVFMHRVDCKRGYPCWHANGDWHELQNPDWKELLGEYVEFTEKGEVKLSLDNAVRLGILHSSDYRTQLETIYLSAIDVSTERFRFDVQFFGSNETSFTTVGENASPLGEQNILETDTMLDLRKRFATGAELVVGFANSIVWQFAGPDTNSTMSLLNFSLVQPLLRAGGRVVALEQLTIVERTLLGNLRAFQRYRQGYYTNVAVGEANVAGTQRRGGFFGGTGLTGFTGQGSSGFGEVGEATGVGRAGFGNGGGGANAGTGFAGGGAGTVGGFIGLLQQLQQVRNTEDSLQAQTRTLGLLEANLEAGIIDIAQVDQFRQNIETERANLLQARNTLANAQETFKTFTLGLPPDLPIQLDDALIRQFRFIDPETTRSQNRIDDFIHLLGELAREPSQEALEKALGMVQPLREDVAKQVAVIKSDLQRLEQVREDRKKNLTPRQAKALESDRQKLLESFDELVARFDETAEQLVHVQQQVTTQNRVKTTDQLVELSTRLSAVIQELALVQARARLESVNLAPVELTPQRALAIARANRFDWMNNRAALVDTWRLIAFNANALKANLDITFSGDVSTVGDNPFRFHGSTGTLRAGLRFDAPLTRLLERNNYRQSLIDYQRDRRRLLLYEDSVNLNLRRLLRQLDQLQQNMEIQRRAVVIAVRRVDQTRETLVEPPQPVAPGEQAARLGPTAAGNLLTALSDLRNSQNNFMSVWLNHYAVRMVLMRELGIMEIDDEGLWVDRPISDADWLEPHRCELPPEVPQEWLQDAGVDPQVLAPASNQASDESEAP